MNKVVYAVVNSQNELISIFSNRASAERFVIVKISMGIEDVDAFFVEVEAINAYSVREYCEYYGWNCSCLPYGIFELEVED